MGCEKKRKETSDYLSDVGSHLTAPVVEAERHPLISLPHGLLQSCSRADARFQR